jgi:predicted dehydrogenase
VAEKYKAVRYTTRWEAVIADPEVDVVVVGVVPKLNPEITRAALKANKPVYVEKPLANSKEECTAIQRCAEQRNLPIAIGFNRRFAPATELLAREFRSTVKPISAFYRISDDDRVRPPEQHWKLKCRLQIEVVHIFDLLFHLFQSEPTFIFARETRLNDSLVTVDFENGCQATVLSSSWGTMEQPKEHMEAILDRASIEMDDYVEVRGYGTEGIPAVTRFAGRRYDDCDNSHVADFEARGLEALLELRKRYNHAFLQSGVLQDSACKEAWDRVKELLGEPPPPQINYSMNKGWGEALESFCLAVADGNRPPNANAVDGNRATNCAVAARLSIETGKPVELDPKDWLPI